MLIGWRRNAYALLVGDVPVAQKFGVAVRVECFEIALNEFISHGCLQLPGVGVRP